jgi:glutamine phosphoribosylpyrophosphate amidotransferase
MVVMDDDGMHSMRFAPAKQPLKSCIFELIYLARPDSIIYNRPFIASATAAANCWLNTTPRRRIW